MNINGWQIYYFRTFADALDELEAEVTALAAGDPRGYKTHPKTRLLASVYKAVTERVPANPDNPDFRLGKTLGKRYANWRRVKRGMPDRYRLFFALRRGRSNSLSTSGSMTRTRCAKPAPGQMFTKPFSACSRAGRCPIASIIL